jgi:hypothetical protein
LIQTWSIATGALLYNLPQPRFGKKFAGFEVYRTNENDRSYCGNNYNFGHCSKSLIVSKNPLIKLDKSFDETKKKRHGLDTTPSKEYLSSTTADVERQENPRSLYKFFYI